MAEIRQKCKYWDTCYRKEKTHLQRFIHPAELTPAAAATAGKGANNKTASPAVDLTGKKVVFTGRLTKCGRKEAEARAQKAGCQVIKAVSSKTNYLVCGEESGGKLSYAESLGITVLSEEEWEDLIKKASGEAGSDGEESEEEMDTSDYASGGDASPSPSKPKLKRNRTHEMSDEEDAPKPTLQRRRSQRLSLKEEGKDDLNPPAAKKARVEKAVTKPAAGPSRPKCRYYGKCYRKDPNHLKAYRHPPKAGTSGGGDGGEEEDMEEDEEDSPAPLHDMADGETAEVSGGLHGALKYTVKRIGDHYSCTCTAWKMQKAAVDSRTCRHLRQYLGDEYENKRTAFDPETKPEPSRQLKHKNVSVLLAQKYTENVDPKGWWLSEKLDGVRAYWDGKCFYSRLGNEFLPPKWFIKGLPTDMCMDGELFGGRGKFQSTVSIVKTPESSRWKDVKYCVFDVPSLKKPFEARLKAMNQHFEDNDVPYAYALEHEICRGRDHVTEELERVEALGGEGIMLREPKSMYVGSRSHSLLKVKSFHDAEAVVIGHEKGKGRNSNVCGALVCRMACGKQFKVGSGLSDKERRSPPKKGSIITYRFQELTNSGSPRFPTFVGVRIDLDKPSDAVLPPKPSD